MTTQAPSRVRVERGPKRVRACLAGEVVVDTLTPYLVWEKPYFPTYYLPVDDLTAELVPTGHADRDAERGEATVYDVKLAVRLSGAYGGSK